MKKWYLKLWPKRWDGSRHAKSRMSLSRNESTFHLEIIAYGKTLRSLRKWKVIQWPEVVSKKRLSWDEIGELGRETNYSVPWRPLPGVWDVFSVQREASKGLIDLI